MQESNPIPLDLWSNALTTPSTMLSTLVVNGKAYSDALFSGKGLVIAQRAVQYPPLSIRNVRLMIRIQKGDHYFPILIVNLIPYIYIHTLTLTRTHTHTHTYTVVSNSIQNLLNYTGYIDSLGILILSSCLNSIVIMKPTVFWSIITYNIIHTVSYIWESIVPGTTIFPCLQLKPMT